MTFNPFGEINQAIAAARRGDTIKAVLRISDPDQAKRRDRTSYRAR